MQGANKTDYQRFAKVQQDVYGNATFGWAYWTLQNVNPVWIMTYMIQNSHQPEELEIIANIYTNCNKYNYNSIRINKPILEKRIY